MGPRLTAAPTEVVTSDRLIIYWWCRRLSDCCSLSATGGVCVLPDCGSLRKVLNSGAFPLQVVQLCSLIVHGLGGRKTRLPPRAQLTCHSAGCCDHGSSMLKMKKNVFIFSERKKRLTRWNKMYFYFPRETKTPPNPNIEEA